MTYEGLEKRTLDRETLSLDQQAVRAAEHRFKWQLPGNYDEIPNAQFGGGAEMKEAVQKILEEVKVNEATEVTEVSKLVEKQLSGAVDLVQTKLIKPDMEFNQKPDLALVMKLMNLTLEQAQVILKMQNPRLELALEDMPFANYCTAIDVNKNVSGQINTYVNPDLNWCRRSAQQEGQVTWTPCIGESSQEIEEKNPWAGQRLDRQVANWDQSRPIWLQSQSRESYVLRQMRGIASGNPLDQKFWSVLRDLTQNKLIAGGGWRYDRVGFYGVFQYVHTRFARFRAEVVGEKCT
ncbi:MAG: hypothetical protein ABII07_04265 [Patescibacteria group bacterium]|nr:hypothetical protein [Patescibacteria group bacterium]